MKLSPNTEEPSAIDAEWLALGIFVGERGVPPALEERTGQAGIRHAKPDILELRTRDLQTDFLGAVLDVVLREGHVPLATDAVPDHRVRLR